jgi:hypothetical protein
MYFLKTLLPSITSNRAASTFVECMDYPRSSSIFTLSLSPIWYPKYSMVKKISPAGPIQLLCNIAAGIIAAPESADRIVAVIAEETHIGSVIAPAGREKSRDEAGEHSGEKLFVDVFSPIGRIKTISAALRRRQI